MTLAYSYSLKYKVTYYATLQKWIIESGSRQLEEFTDPTKAWKQWKNYKDQ